MHTVVLPLRSTERDLQIVSEALSIVGSLRNATLGELLSRVDNMRLSPEWFDAISMPKGPEKTRTFRELQKKHRLSSHDAVRVCHAHWRDSRWMGGRIGGRIATALASEVWLDISEHIYGRSRRPRFKPSSGRTVVWNNDNKSGLLLREGKIEWTVATKRKCLSIPLHTEAISRSRRKWLNTALKEGRLRRVGIKRESIRGKDRLFALICLEGDPYRSEEYLSRTKKDEDVLGLDLGPTWLSMVSAEDSHEISIASKERIAADAKLRARSRRRQRAAMRSRRNSNAHAQRKGGRSVKGVRQPHRSKRGLLRERLASDDRRRDRLSRKRDRARAVRLVMQTNTHIALEDLDYRSWQREKFGRRMLITAPGDFVSRLQREAGILGGSVTLIDPWEARASQTCLCGARTGKKKLSERTHCCDNCGLEAPRDLVSAALVRELALAGEKTWNEELAKASGTKNAAAEIIQRSRRTSSSRKTAPGKRGVKQSRERVSTRSRALLCEKQKPDPEDNTHPSSHVPTCEQPDLSAGASRKAAVGREGQSDPVSLLST